MQTGVASETARISAAMRAAHRLLDDAPWIFVDDMAMALSGFMSKAALRDMLVAQEEQLTALAGPTAAKAFTHTGRLCTALRARFAEDVLADAMRQGVSQYVLLGAGFDSY